MKFGKLAIWSLAAGFLLALPVIWIVSSLAADLRQFHPVAGWAVWVATAAAILCLLWPVVQFLRLPPMPPRGIWDEKTEPRNDRAWKDTAELLIDTCPDSEAKAKLRRKVKELPNDLRRTVREELERRRDLAGELRLAAVRQAAMLSFLSPHRQLDALILLWLNLRQVFTLSRCYGFKPSPRGIIRLYGSVLGIALTLEAFDELAEQAFADVATRVGGGIPGIGHAATMVYDPLRAAAYVGFIGLVGEHLLRTELRKPDREERKKFRAAAWKNALAEIPKLQAAREPSPGSS